MGQRNVYNGDGALTALSAPPSGLKALNLTFKYSYFGKRNYLLKGAYG